MPNGTHLVKLKACNWIFDIRELFTVKLRGVAENFLKKIDEL
jgi:hypothetical protein